MAEHYNKYYAFSKDELEHLLCTLCCENNERILQCNSLTLMQSSPYCINYIFSVCQHFKQDRIVQYLALLLFEKMNTLFLENILKKCTAEEQPTDLLVAGIASAGDRAKHAAVLNALVCILMASKVNTREHVMPENLVEFSKHCGHKFSIKDIIRVEMNFFENANFKITYHTPYEYIHCILNVLSYNDPFWDYTSLRREADLVLDFVYFHRENIYESLYQLLTGKCTSPESCDSINKLKCDYVMLACGIIMAVASSKEEESSMKMLQQLHELMHLPAADIARFAFAIKKEFEDNEKSV